MPAGARGGVLRALAALALVQAALVLPLRLPGAPPGPWLALEALVLVGVFALLPRRRWTPLLAGAAGIAVSAAAVLALGDSLARRSLARPLNLYLDLHLLDAVSRLVGGAVGPVAGALVIPGLLLAAGTLAAAVSLLLLPPTRAGSSPPRSTTGRWPHRPILGGALLGGAALLLVAGWTGDRSPRVGTPGVRVVREQAVHLGRMLGERDRFRGELAASTASHAGTPGLLSGLAGRDVILAFVESYGVSALEDPRYAPVVRPRVELFGERVAAAGLHVASGLLESPTQGGQSWFAHGSVLSGLWLDNQLRYDLLLTSGRETLVDDFRRAGHRTVVLMPAITLAWPEGEVFGYDRILARQDIEYRGPPLNWVTMPDQFTWSYLQRAVREDPDPRPVFAEVGLISSHAPWTPILPVLEDWEAIGDGAVFAPWENAGERPVDLWRDHDRVREHYALSVDYAVAAMTGYAERYVDDRTLLLVMGDHQPAPMITGEGASRAVPVHVVSGDPELLQPFLEWGFVPGPLPPAGGEAPHRMDAFRDWFVGAYSGGAGAPGLPPVRAAEDS